MRWEAVVSTQRITDAFKLARMFTAIFIGLLSFCIYCIALLVNDIAQLIDPYKEQAR